jgi:hypothetical protein
MKKIYVFDRWNAEIIKEVNSIKEGLQVIEEEKEKGTEASELVDGYDVINENYESLL